VFDMTATRKILARALALTALAAIAVPAAADASQSKGHKETRIVGRIASISSTGLTVGTTQLAATSTQLTGFSSGQCVEAQAKRSAAGLRLVKIHREDRCGTAKAPTMAAASATQAAVVDDSQRGGGLDDPANHDAGDDNGQRSGGLDDPASHDAGDDNGLRGGGTDDPANHDAGDDHGRHGSSHA
jgi:hypothetical protein